MTFKDKKIVSCIVSFFFPGLGNVIMGDRTFGWIVFAATLIITLFYFVPLIPMYFGHSKLLLVTTVLACFLWIVDVGLLVWSIVRIVRLTK